MSLRRTYSRDELLSEMRAKLLFMGVSIQPPIALSPQEVSYIIFNTKGSCHTVEESGDGGVDISVDCELYVDDPPQHLVALGKFYSNYILFIFINLCGLR